MVCSVFLVCSSFLLGDIKRFAQAEPIRTTCANNYKTKQYFAKKQRFQLDECKGSIFYLLRLQTKGKFISFLFLCFALHEPKAKHLQPPYNVGKLA